MSPRDFTWGGVSGYTLCTGEVPPPQEYVFHNFCLGRVLFSGPKVWQGGGVFWSWFGAGKGCNFTFFSVTGRTCLSGKSKLCHSGLHTPIHNLSSRVPRKDVVAFYSVFIHVRTRQFWPLLTAVCPVTNGYNEVFSIRKIRDCVFVFCAICAGRR